MNKKYFENKRAVIFDLDGTVFKEAEELRKESFEKVVRDEKLDYINPKPYCISGYSSETIWEAILDANEVKDKKINDLVNKTAEAYLEIVKNTEIKTAEGFWDFFYELKQEKNFKIGITSNTPKAIQEIVMKKLEINGIFDAEIFGDDVKKLKPHPEIYKKILRLLKVSPKETIVFEDSIPGVKSAVEAKIDTFVIWDGVTRKSLFEDKVFDFSRDFIPYPGTLDETHEEYIMKSYTQALENKERQ